jgi:hypothetical protein
MPISYAIELGDLVEHLGEVLRYGGHELHTDIDDRYQPGKTTHLIEACDHHTAMITRATPDEPQQPPGSRTLESRMR